MHITVEDLRKRHSQPATAVVETEVTVAAKPTYRNTRPEVEPATEKQVAFLRKLVAERMPQVDSDYTDSVIAQGKHRVSQAIDKLLATPPAKTETPAPQPRTNRYPGRCEECGTRVEAEEGILSKTDDGEWEVSHRDGECPANEFPFPLGRYAVETDEGHLAFYHVKIDGLFVQAGDELHRVPVNSQQAIIDKIATDPEAASLRYGQEIGACGRCGRTLTDENSRAMGIGPICANKGWGV